MGGGRVRRRCVVGEGDGPGAVGGGRGKRRKEMGLGPWEEKMGLWGCGRRR